MNVPIPVAVAEIVRFSLVPQIELGAFIDAAAATGNWLAEQPGYIRRSLSNSNGVWTDVVMWRDLVSAEAAAAAIGGAPGAAKFLAMIDGKSVTMRHEEVFISSN